MYDMVVIVNLIEVIGNVWFGNIIVIIYFFNREMIVLMMDSDWDEK